MYRKRTGPGFIIGISLGVFYIAGTGNTISDKNQVGIMLGLAITGAFIGHLVSDPE